MLSGRHYFTPALSLDWDPLISINSSIVASPPSPPSYTSTNESMHLAILESIFDSV